MVRALHAHRNTRTYKNTHFLSHAHTNTRTCARACTCTRVCTCIRSDRHHAHIYACVHSHTHARTHAHAHTYTFTHASKEHATTHWHSVTYTHTHIASDVAIATPSLLSLPPSASLPLAFIHTLCLLLWLAFLLPLSNQRTHTHTPTPRRQNTCGPCKPLVLGQIFLTGMAVYDS